MINEYEIGCDSLRKSICFLLGEKCKIQNNRLQLLVKKVETLENYLSKHKKLSTDLGLPLLFNLENQNQFLQSNESCCIFCISIKDVLVLDDSIFIFINSNHVKPIDCNGILSFYSPFSRREFCSPEILELQQIPCSVTKKTFYYSLGALLIFCITGNNPGAQDCLEHLNSIKKSKLYWTISRLVCLEPSKRSFLYV